MSLLWDQIRALFLEIQNIEEADVDGLGETDADISKLEDKIDVLMRQRVAERASEISKLPCCKDGGEHVSCLRLEPLRGEPYMAWVVGSLMHLYSAGGSDGHPMPISFCPFCGKKTPGFRKKASPPPHVHQPVRDGDYCGACDQRSRGCFCSFLESEWEADV